MELGKASTYALFATIYIAERNHRKPIQGRKIASERGLPFGYLLKILQQLVKNDILQSQVGRAGGFTLRRSPENTTILEVIEAVEGPIRGRIAMQDGDGVTKKSARLLVTTCEVIAGLARDELRKVTIQDLIQ